MYRFRDITVFSRIMNLPDNNSDLEKSLTFMHIVIFCIVRDTGHGNLADMYLK